MHISTTIRCKIGPFRTASLPESARIEQQSLTEPYPSSYLSQGARLGAKCVCHIIFISTTKQKTSHRIQTLESNSAYIFLITTKKATAHYMIIGWTHLHYPFTISHTYTKENTPCFYFLLHPLIIHPVSLTPYKEFHLRAILIKYMTY